MPTLPTSSQQYFNNNLRDDLDEVQHLQDILKLYYYYHWFPCTFTIDAECRVQLSALILITGTLMQIRTKTKEYFEMVVRLDGYLNLNMHDVAG